MTDKNSDRDRYRQTDKNRDRDSKRQREADGGGRADYLLGTVYKES